MFRKIFSLIHKILGIPLSIIFVLWFLSGFAMIWYSFPRAKQPVPTDALSAEILPMDTLLSIMPDSGSIRSLSVYRKYGRDVMKLSTNDSTIEVYANNLEPVPAFSEEFREVVVNSWCDARITRIDTLEAVDQWIPFERWNDKMPILKYYFDDKEGHQLYMTTEGDVIQFTTAKDRRLAWLAGIPHWLYFTPLRKHQELWTDVVVWSALLGCVMCLSGIIVAIIVWWHQRKAYGLWHCPYRKPWWRWHFILGLLFGWCAITFSFSGYMSMGGMPSFLKKEKQEQKDPDSKNRDQRKRDRRRGGRDRMVVDPDRYLLPIAKVVAEGGDSIVSIQWASWNDHPYYQVTYHNSRRNIDASVADNIQDFKLSAEMVERDARKQFHDSVGITVSYISEYDDDYYGRDKNKNPLPVYKVVADDYMNTVIYYDPLTLSTHRVDDDGRSRRFLYKGLHALHIKALTDHPTVWYAVMFILLTGGSMLSVTGLVLALQWLWRTVRRLRRE